MTRKKKSANQSVSSPSPSTSDLNINLELDNRALRAKNAQLVQAVAKLQQEKAQQQNQLALLHNEYFKLNSNFANLKNVFAVIESTSKESFPKLIEHSEMFAKIMHLSTLGSRISDLNKDLRTQKVKPHIVNGHVLQDPTINLSRMTDIVTTSPQRTQCQANSRQENLSRPGPSGNNTTENQNNENIPEVNQDNNDNMVTRRPYITKRSRVPPDFQPINMEELQQEVMDSDEAEEEEEETNENDNFRSRLITIQEEDEEHYSHSPNNSRIISEVVREMTIFLDPLPKDCLKLHRKANSDKTNSTLSHSSSLQNSSAESNSTLISTRETVISQNKINLAGNVKSSSYYRRDTYDHGSNDLEVSNFITTTMEQSNGRLREAREYSSNIVTPRNASSRISDSKENCTSNNFSDDLENTKLFTLRHLGLTPTDSLTTSTPKNQSGSITRRKFNLSSESLTPTRGVNLLSSNVTMKRGRSHEKTKVPKILLKRLSLKKRLSGSPAKKIGDALGMPIITRPSLKKRRISPPSSDESSSDFDYIEQLSLEERSSGMPLKKKASNIKQRSRDSTSSDENSDFDQNEKKTLLERLNDEHPSKAEKENIRSSPDKVAEKVAVKSKKIPKRLYSTVAKRMSPRPTRAARPNTLKEPNLMKKLRRSK